MLGKNLDISFFFSTFSFLLTYNLIWRRCTGYVAFHLSSLPSHCILDWITGDDGRTCSGQKKWQDMWVCVNERNGKKKFLKYHKLQKSDSSFFFYFFFTRPFQEELYDLKKINGHHFGHAAFFFQLLTSWPFTKYKLFIYKQQYFEMCGGFLTVDGERDLSLSYSNPWDDGLTYILAGICLAHRLQIQLVAVTQNLWGSEKKHTNINKAKLLNSRWG